MNALLPGPLHPDLYDGESPLMVTPDDLSAYRVEVAPAGCELAAAILELAAVGARQAHDYAVADYASASGEHTENLTVVSMELLERSPTHAEKRAWLARQEGVA